MSSKPCAVLLVLCMLSAPALAAHITDKLVVGMYAGPKAEGAPLNLLSSGTPVEVLKRADGFAEVRLADDSTGWVEATYVTEEKPAMAMLLETQARLRQMGIELAGLREKQSAGGAAADAAVKLPPNAGEAQLRQSLDMAEARIAELEKQLVGQPSAEQLQRLTDLQDRARQALQLLADAQGLELRPVPAVGEGLISRYRSWIVGLTALLLGFGAGIAFIDYRIRRRYGRFRI
ncbi:MAG: SH3 domain-containing protein [Chromatiaceae bacterium]|jgi:SH3 domain protein|nr:SH3 domain-containing protein [Chromatiaceae bacterium]